MAGAWALLGTSMGRALRWYRRRQTTMLPMGWLMGRKLAERRNARVVAANCQCAKWVATSGKSQELTKIRRARARRPTPFDERRGQAGAKPVAMAGPPQTCFCIEQGQPHPKSVLGPQYRQRPWNLRVSSRPNATNRVVAVFVEAKRTDQDRPKPPKGRPRWGGASK